MIDYEYILEYIPQRFETSSKEKKYREIIYNFKEGTGVNDVLKRIFCRKINKIIYHQSSFETIKNIEEKWIICFIPASTKSKTIKRFKKLGEHIQKKTGIPVKWNAISLKKEKQSDHIQGKSDQPVENFKFNPDDFRGKQVLLIDDIITRGLTYEQTKDRLLLYGAEKVYGLFLAKTIHK